MPMLVIIMFTRSGKKLFLVLSAILLLPLALAVERMLEDEAYYRSWEQSRTDRHEVSWMQEPILHKLNRFLSACSNRSG